MTRAKLPLPEPLLRTQHTDVDGLSPDLTASLQGGTIILVSGMTNRYGVNLRYTPKVRLLVSPLEGME